MPFTHDCLRHSRRHGRERTHEPSMPRPSSVDPLATSNRELPNPVARYFAFALPPSVRRIIRADVEWSGTMLLKRDGRPLPFTAHEAFAVVPPGFVWDAKMAMLPGVRVRVCDSYNAGRGMTRARLAGFLSVMTQPGTPQTAEAALQRFLGEAVWFPTALRSSTVAWKAVDADSATATLVDCGNRASVDFHFGDLGEVIACSALRQRDIGSRSVLTPWRTRTWDYIGVDGIMIPRSAEAEWLLPDGVLTYWRGTVERVTYEYDSLTTPEAPAFETKNEIRRP